MFISHNKAKYALISDLTRPGPARPGITLFRRLYLRNYLTKEAEI